jgi:NAD(P)-dependent dehydrogenase (short-subunit alcohol dehydrogenase family)
MKFSNKVAIVTGASQGIGAHYATALATQGACVVVADIKDNEGRAVVKSIEDTGGKAIFVSTDVSSEESARNCTKVAVDTYGSVDFLINNAAIYAGMLRANWMDVPLEYYRKMMSVNVDGSLIMTRAVHKAMIARGGGAIINQSSTAAYISGGYYGLSKLATNGLTIALAKELGPHGIRVNGIAPGPTDTMATRTTVAAEALESFERSLPLRRLGETQDMVNGCLFLLSDEAAWITGQTLCIDGGMILKPC